MPLIRITAVALLGSERESAEINVESFGVVSELELGQVQFGLKSSLFRYYRLKEINFNGRPDLELISHPWEVEAVRALSRMSRMKSTTELEYHNSDENLIVTAFAAFYREQLRTLRERLLGLLGRLSVDERDRFVEQEPSTGRFDSNLMELESPEEQLPRAIALLSLWESAAERLQQALA